MGIFWIIFRQIFFSKILSWEWKNFRTLYLEVIKKTFFVFEKHFRVYWEDNETMSFGYVIIFCYVILPFGWSVGMTVEFLIGRALWIVRGNKAKNGATGAIGWKVVRIDMKVFCLDESKYFELISWLDNICTELDSTRKYVHHNET